MRLLPAALLLTTALACLNGCATVYRVQVSALSDSQLAEGKRTYTLAPGNKEARATDLQYREMAGYARAALKGRGYLEQPDDAGQADLRIEVSYGMGDPVTRTVTFVTPVYAELGGGVSRTTKQSVDAAGKTTTTTETSVIPGRYERIGSDVSTQLVTSYRKHLQLSARENRPEGVEVWNVAALCDDATADLRAVAPYLVTALAPHIGQRTPKAVYVDLKAEDPAVQRLLAQ